MVGEVENRGDAKGRGPGDTGVERAASFEWKPRWPARSRNSLLSLAPRTPILSFILKLPPLPTHRAVGRRPGSEAHHLGDSQRQTGSEEALPDPSHRGGSGHSESGWTKFFLEAARGPRPAAGSEVRRARRLRSAGGFTCEGPRRGCPGAPSPAQLGAGAFTRRS